MWMKPIMMPFFTQEVMVHFGIGYRQNIKRIDWSFYTNNKPVAFVCHSPAVLKNVKVNGEF
jgi:hypothetical protein